MLVSLSPTGRHWSRATSDNPLDCDYPQRPQRFALSTRAEFAFRKRTQNCARSAPACEVRRYGPATLPSQFIETDILGLDKLTSIGYYGSAQDFVCISIMSSVRSPFKNSARGRTGDLLADACGLTRGSAHRSSPLPPFPPRRTGCRGRCKGVPTQGLGVKESGSRTVAAVSDRRHR